MLRRRNGVIFQGNLRPGPQLRERPPLAHRKKANGHPDDPGGRLSYQGRLAAPLGRGAVLDGLSFAGLGCGLRLGIDVQGLRRNAFHHVDHGRTGRDHTGKMHDVAVVHANASG